MIRELVNSPRIRSLKDKALELASNVLGTIADMMHPMVEALLDKYPELLMKPQELLVKYEELTEKYQQAREDVSFERIFAGFREEEKDIIIRISENTGIPRLVLVKCILEDFCRRYPKLSKTRKQDFLGRIYPREIGE